jgi:hypothetical protein
VEIGGVVPAIRDDMTEELNAHVYVPFGARYRSAMTLRIKTDPGADTAVTIPIRQTIAEIDRRVPVLSIQTLTEHRDASGALLALTLISGIFRHARRHRALPCKRRRLRAARLPRRTAHARVRHPPGARRHRAG